MNKTKITNITVVALMAALISIVAPFSIPIGPVPITFANFVIFLAVYLLGWKRGVMSCGIYLLIGLVGFPVFSGFGSGIGKIMGPTGGYLIGYLFMALVAGVIMERFPNQIWICGLGMVLGTLVEYGFGTAWLANQASMPFGAALAAGVYPFIIGDVIKIVLVLVIGKAIRPRLQSFTSVI